MSPPDTRGLQKRINPKSRRGQDVWTSALQYHELTLQMPSAVWMAIDRAAWRPKIDYQPIRFVRFTGSALTEGVERYRIESVDVPITDPARTIVDCFRCRTKVGFDVAMEALREGLRRRRCKPDQLWRYARQMRVWPIMRPYVEAMVSNSARAPQRRRRQSGCGSSKSTCRTAGFPDCPESLCARASALSAERLTASLTVSSSKGAMLVVTWVADPLRLTRDPDLLGHRTTDAEALPKPSGPFVRSRLPTTA